MEIHKRGANEDHAEPIKNLTYCEAFWLLTGPMSQIQDRDFSFKPTKSLPFYFDQQEYKLMYATIGAYKGQLHSDSSSVSHHTINAFIYLSPLIYVSSV